MLTIAAGVRIQRDGSRTQLSGVPLRSRMESCDGRRKTETTRVDQVAAVTTQSHPGPYRHTSRVNGQTRSSPLWSRRPLHLAMRRSRRHLTMRLDVCDRADTPVTEDVLPSRSGSGTWGSAAGSATGAPAARPYPGIALRHCVLPLVVRRQAQVAVQTTRCW